MSDSSGMWNRVEIAGREADVFLPGGGGPFAAAVIYLHSQSQESLAADAVFTAELNRHRLPCVCPRGGRSWWLDQAHDAFGGDSPMSHVREQLVGWIEETWDLSPPLVGLMGIEMGGQGALQIAYRDARRFPVVAAISPAIDFQRLHGQGGEIDRMFESPEAARQQTVTLHLHPLNWPTHQLFVCDPADPVWYEGCERLASKLSSIGIPYECDLETSAGGLSWEYFHAMAPRSVAFVAASLESVRTKLAKDR